MKELDRMSKWNGYFRTSFNLGADLNPTFLKSLPLSTAVTMRYSTLTRPAMVFTRLPITVFPYGLLQELYMHGPIEEMKNISLIGSPARLSINHRTNRPQIQYSIVQYSIVQYSIVQYSIVQYSTVQYSTVQYSTVQYQTSIVQRSVAQHSIAQ